MTASDGNARRDHRRRPQRWLTGLLACVLVGGCTGTTIVRVVPPNADVTVDGVPLRQNWIEYGRWIGNEYVIRASAPDYEDASTVADVHLGSRCGLIAFYSLVSVIGSPIALTCPWQGQIEDEITLVLDRKTGAPGQDEPKATIEREESR